MIKLPTRTWTQKLFVFQFETRQSLTKFEGSSSISSADLFGEDRQKSRASYGSNAPDLQDIKEGVRQGVTKVAGKISTLANGVMSSLQVCKCQVFLNFVLNILWGIGSLLVEETKRGPLVFSPF